MHAKTLEIISDTKIRVVEPRWNHLRSTGSLVAIAGLLGSTSEIYDKNKIDLKALLEGKSVEIRDFPYLSGNTLRATVYYNDKLVQKFGNVPKVSSQHNQQPLVHHIRQGWDEHLLRLDSHRRDS